MEVRSCANVEVVGKPSWAGESFFSGFAFSKKAQGFHPAPSILKWKVGLTAAAAPHFTVGAAVASTVASPALTAQ